MRISRFSPLLKPPKNTIDRLIKTSPESLLIATVAVSSVILALVGLSGRLSNWRFTTILMGLLCVNVAGLCKLQKILLELKNRQTRINEQLLQSNKLSALGEIVTGIARLFQNYKVDL